MDLLPSRLGLSAKFGLGLHPIAPAPGALPSGGRLAFRQAGKVDGEIHGMG